MLSAKTPKEVDRAVAKYLADQRQSVMMAVLAVVQGERGRVSSEVMQFVAEYPETPPVWVEEVATFYNIHDARSIGRSKLSMCTNLPRTLSGDERVVDYLKKKLGIDFNKAAADGNFTLKEGECMSTCGDAPAMIVNNTHMCSFMSNEKLDALIIDPQSKAPTNGVGK